MPKPVEFHYWTYDTRTEVETEHVVDIPTVNTVCPTCDGEGQHSQHLGVLDMEEWEPEELDLYRQGAYDTICNECKGKRVVVTMDHAWLDAHPDIRREVEESERCKAEMRYTERMERMMGA